MRQVKVGNLSLGGGEIYIQSMLNKPPDDIEGNLSQAEELERAGCDILRAAVPDFGAVRLISALKERVLMPIAADIHFNYKLAIESVAAGADKIRINPGNIGSDENIRRTVSVCRSKNVPIRIGVNSGSLEKDILKKYGSPCAEALAESALRNIRLLEKFDFEDIIVSVKSSDVKTVIAANRILARECGYPLHLGVTEAGTERMGTIKSAIGIGALLADGIGQTIRVSLTGDPVSEIYAAKDMLSALGLRKGINIISCPTCGRTKTNLISFVREAEKALDGISKDITVAIMGCEVNGPGEAASADVGVAFCGGNAVIFKNGKIIKKINEDNALKELINEVNDL